MSIIGFSREPVSPVHLKHSFAGAITPFVPMVHGAQELAVRGVRGAGDLASEAAGAAKGWAGRTAAGVGDWATGILSGRQQLQQQTLANARQAGKIKNLRNQVAALQQEVPQNFSQALGKTGTFAHQGITNFVKSNPMLSVLGAAGAGIGAAALLGRRRNYVPPPQQQQPQQSAPVMTMAFGAPQQQQRPAPRPRGYDRHGRAYY